jgi:hypothetical protein
MVGKLIKKYSNNEEMYDTYTGTAIFINSFELHQSEIKESNW